MTTSVQQPTLAYEEHGTGVPVVFLHGLTFDRTTWRPIVDRLGDQIRSVAIDLPGHGESGGSPCRLDELAGRVHELLDEIGIERPLLVGHSMGGVIAPVYAATYPTLAVVNVDQPMNVRPFSQTLKQIAPALRGDGFEAAFAPFQRSIGIDRIDEPRRSEVLAKQRIRRDLVLGYWDEALQADPAELQARVDAALDRIHVPFLFVFGRELA